MKNPHTIPFIILFTIVSPEKPKIECVISGIPRKSSIILDNVIPGGRAGNPRVMLTRAKKAIAKTIAIDIFFSDVSVKLEFCDFDC